MDETLERYYSNESSRAVLYLVVFVSCNLKNIYFFMFSSIFLLLGGETGLNKQHHGPPDETGDLSTFNTINATETKNKLAMPTVSEVKY